MNKYSKISLLGFWILAVAVNTALADPVVVNITGKVKASPCTVDTNSVSQSVDFGQQRSTDLKEAGTATPWQSFQVNLTNCPAGTRTATVTFAGPVSADDATLYANTGEARNVAVQVAQNVNKGIIQGNGSTMSVDVDAQHKATYALAGRLYSVNGNTTPGTFSSVVQMNFTYQ
ncbi:TPA: fimbrial protein [Yersinia enterocolitica]|nr:type 1 fimbrial protein [Yersinia enterocolitica]HEN3613774.1 type 1 fimbrial protein [Yersinia enterocolitica]HEN3639322.1 type 1 fimbrial protein [Yersinia enterocolitica]HEN3647599.1 type 1 fimbrial protein [Yersinia enterocolitica]